MLFLSPQPYLKPENTPQYIDARSNHPPSIIKAVPEGVNKRLSEISSNEESFNKTAHIYQKALDESGHKYKLQYKNYEKKEKKNRSRKITWFNPPFDLNVKTNIGKCFLTIVDNSFPPEHPLRKIFNRNTLKLSYSCLPNVKSTIDAHNKKILKIDDKTETKPCNCRNKEKCPLDGKCREKELVYQATITATEPTRDGTGKQRIETYIGLTSTEFKTRYNNHKSTIEKKEYATATELSKHIWKLKDRDIRYNIEWNIKGKAPAYNNKLKKCKLCNLEKFFIIYHSKEASLNQKCGLINSCKHFSKYLLGNQ